MNVDDDEETCCICLDFINEYTCNQHLKCKHKFHVKCISNISEMKCPLCRNDISKSLTKRQRKIIQLTQEKFKKERYEEIEDEVMSEQVYRTRRLLILLYFLTIIIQNPMSTNECILTFDI